MASIDRTAYPRFPAQLSDRELDRDYRLSDPERLFVRRQARGDAGRLSLALLLKTRQRLGYFAVLVEIPERVRAHVAKDLGLAPATPVVDEVDRPATVHRYRTALREWLGSRPFSHGGRAIVTATVHRAAQTMSDPADLISASVEALVKHQVEVPAFATLDRLIGNLRQEIHEGLYAGIDAALDEDQRQLLDALLVRADGARLNPFSQLKSTPGPATLKHLREWIQRLADLDALLDPGPLLAGLSHTKVRQFAAEAAAMESGDLRDVCLPGRRHTLLLCLLHQAQSDTRDQLVEMFVRRMRRTQSEAIERLHEVQADHQGIEERLLGLFGQVLHHADVEGDDQDLGRRVRSLLLAQGGVETLAAQLQAVTAYHSDNYFPLLWPIHSVHRSALFSLFDLLDLRSAISDSRLLDAYRVVREHRRSRRAALPVALDLGFASQRWQTFVRERSGETTLVRRRALELCVFVHLADALKSGDVFVVGSGAFADYRTQLLPWAECVPRLEEYCTAVGLPANATTFVAELRQRLIRLAEQVDVGFPDNSELSIDADGTPHLTRLGPQRLPEGLAAFEAAVRSRMPERHLLDVLKHAQHWSSFARHFGPPSGSDAKIPDATRRYLLAVFGYGCNLGASQTARHAPEVVNRHSLRRINDQHVNVEKLEAAQRDLINAYARFELPLLWGRPNVAIADGTHVELRENNLLGERHIRYGRYGGIAYHHISATYVALFGNFIACGVWEAVYILDALLQNRSDFEADTVHADTHGQSEPVFALAYLLGIDLFPRMRTWTDAVFYRPDRTVRYRHIDALFAKTVDWELIETHWPDFMQVVLSIQAGQVLPSMLLRRLGSHNRQSRLYRAFRELGRVVRTLFLLRYVSESPFRESIRAETTKIESYNDFLDWIGFGGPVLKSGDPVEQLKQVKYMDLVANAIMLHNVVDLTEVLSAMVAEGLPVTKALVARLSPYLRDHLLRFGKYAVDMDDLPPALEPRSLPDLPDGRL